MGKKITQEEFVQRVADRLGPDYEVLGTYEGRDIPILMKHYVCGNTFLKRPHDVSSKGSGCPYCNGSRPARYNEQWVKDNTPLPYHYVSGYKAMKEKCLFHCDKCGQDFYQLPSRLINQHIYGCGCCPTKKKTHEQFLNEIKDVLDEYEVIDQYVNIDTPITFIHKPCGCAFKLSPYKFIHRHDKKYCPICYYNKSKGEIEITKSLTALNIDFQREFSFPGFPNKRFDFYLPEYNAAIEYDGIQHFQETFFSKNEDLEVIQARDKEKNDWCNTHNITLYRIPYSDYDNIAQIICKIFKEESSTTIERYKITQQSRE